MLCIEFAIKRIYYGTNINRIEQNRIEYQLLNDNLVLKNN